MVASVLKHGGVWSVEAALNYSPVPYHHHHSLQLRVQLAP